MTNASDLNTKQKEALKAQVTSAGRVSAANGVEHTATELNTAMTAFRTLPLLIKLRQKLVD
ncbi:hypothetical protein ACVPOY_10710 [Staphylococcus aureus]